jgi:hypothetical protein
MIARLLFIALLLAAPDDAGAGNTTLYGADGRVQGRSSTSGGTTTFWGADGRRVGTEVGR